MSAFRVRESAANDLYEIGLTSRENWGDAQVELYVAKLVHAFTLFAEMPLLGKACDELKPGWRRLHQGTHVIFYRLEPDGIVDIIRVLHERMQPDLHMTDVDDD